MKTPNYIKELVLSKRLVPASSREQLDELGRYELNGGVWRLYRKNNHQQLTTLEAEAEKVCGWCLRAAAPACAYVISQRYFTEAEHRKPHYQRDYVLIRVSAQPAAILAGITI